MILYTIDKMLFWEFVLITVKSILFPCVLKHSSQILSFENYKSGQKLKFQKISWFLNVWNYLKCISVIPRNFRKINFKFVTDLRRIFVHSYEYLFETFQISLLVVSRENFVIPHLRHKPVKSIDATISRLNFFFEIIWIFPQNIMLMWLFKYF